MLVVAVGKYSQAGVIKSLASGEEGIKSWVMLDGNVDVTTGSAEVVYHRHNDKIEKLVKASSHVKIANVDLVVTKSTKTGFTLEKPYGNFTHTILLIFYKSCVSHRESCL